MARILVVDDDTEIRELLRQFLDRAGYEVLVASDGNAALNIHRATPVDLMITDIVMPEREGLETIMEIRHHSPSVKIIAISGGGRVGANEYLNVARVLGAQKTLSKPFELGELLSTIRDLLPTS